MTIENRTIAPRALYRRTDISPEQFFQALGQVRKAVQDEIERLIVWLDSTIDTDQDTAIDDGPIDDTELEPSLGSFDRMSDQIKAWSSHQFHAEGTDRELDTCDDEPSLSSTAAGERTSQDHWTQGNRDDREGDGGTDDREPDVDDEDSADKEPALGWNDEEAARGRYPNVMGRE